MTSADLRRLSVNLREWASGLHLQEPLSPVLTLTIIRKCDYAVALSSHLCFLSGTLSALDTTKAIITHPSQQTRFAGAAKL